MQKAAVASLGRLMVASMWGRKSAALLALALFLFMLGCTLLQQRDPYELVPAGAESVAIIRLSLVVDDPDINAIYSEENPGRTLLGEFGPAIRAGIDPHTITKAVFFDMKGSKAFLFRGSFDYGAVSARLRLDGFAEASYQGHGMLQKTTGGETRAVSVVDGNIVFGDISAVESVLDVADGRKQAFSANADARALISPLDSDALLMLLSLGPVGDVPGPVPLGGLGSARGSGFSLWKSGQDVHLKFSLLADSADGARGLASTLDTSLRLAQVLMPGSSLGSMLTKANVTSSGPVVAVTIETDVQELRAAIRELRES